jgi:hypothetical protein
MSQNGKAEDVTLFRSTLNALGGFLLTFFLNIQAIHSLFLKRLSLVEMTMTLETTLAGS